MCGRLSECLFEYFVAVFALCGLLVFRFMFDSMELRHLYHVSRVRIAFQVLSIFCGLFFYDLMMIGLRLSENA